MTTATLEQVKDHKFEIIGSVTFSSARDLSACGLLKFKKMKEVEVSFAKVINIDSAVLAVLLAWQRFARAKDIKLTFSGCQDNLKVLLKSYHIEDLFDFCD